MIGPLARRRGVRLGLGGALVLGLTAVAAVTIAGSEGDRTPLPARSEVDKPTLMLLTSLPLVFGEGFSLEGGGSPALTALEQRYRVVAISVTDASSLAQGGLLLMAHPRAQPGEALVALDRWVRRGGKVVLLADPALDWPSERPLGDPLRPPPMFADTGLLRHWGVTLTAPDERGPVASGGGHDPIVYSSPGRLVSIDRNCQLSRSGIVADCAIGRGRATIIADADFLNVADLGGPMDGNLPALMAALEALAR